MKKPKKVNRYVRNHKMPILALWENPRYTGACKSLKCPYCRGEK